MHIGEDGVLSDLPAQPLKDPCERADSTSRAVESDASQGDVVILKGATAQGAKRLREGNVDDMTTPQTVDQWMRRRRQGDRNLGFHQ